MAEIAQGVKKIELLVMILPSNKKDLFLDITERFNVNYHISLQAFGSASDEIVALLGLKDLTRVLTFSFIREDKVKGCLAVVEDKINQLGINGVAFSVKLDSIMGIKNYLFLADLGGQKWKKN